MKIIGFDDFEEGMILFAEYDPYLIDAKEIEIIGERGSLFLGGNDIDITWRPCFDDYANVLVGVRTHMKDITEQIGEIKLIVNADYENTIAVIQEGSWGLISAKMKYLKLRRIDIMSDGKLILHEERNLCRDTTKGISIDTNQMRVIMDHIDKIYDSKENTHRDACDGEWNRITLTMPNREVFDTEVGYIYGTETLEPFVEYVRSIIDAGK